MNKRKILILLFVLTIAVGFAINSVSSVSATKTENIYLYKSYSSSGQKVYWNKYDDNRHVSIALVPPKGFSGYRKITVWSFKKVKKVSSAEGTYKITKSVKKRVSWSNKKIYVQTGYSKKRIYAPYSTMGNMKVTLR